ncbi:MAG: hypothetical protein KC503_38375, partial [Myxococcales bacterium]|nr:hypothetical protein [Myxococcales bacterium]
QLLRTAQLAARGGQAQPSKPRGRLLLWIVLVFLVLLLGGGAALFLIKVEARRVVVCRVDRKPVAPIKAPIAGRVARVHVKKQQVLGAGKAALVIATRDKRAEARLRAIIASDKELLRIMRTGGKDADVRKQKRIKRDVEARIAKLGDCKDAACREKKTDLQRELEAAKTKLHFCEWQAYKREADAKAKELAAKEQRLSKQLAAQNRTVIASKGGIVTKHIAAGTTVEKGQTLVEMDDAKNASAVLLIARDPPKSGQLVVVTLAGQGWTKRIKAKTSSEAGRVSVALELDVSKITASTRCRADVPAPPIPLAVSLWRDLR